MNEENKIESNAQNSDIVTHQDAPLTNQTSNQPQPQTNDKPETDNMEVHKHPHHVTHKKKWGEYFLEFLMIFLAVFLGFIAENVREHSVEHNRGRKYAATMIQDLKADIEALQDGINSNTLILEKLDTLLMIYHPENAQPKTTGQLYYYGQFGFRFWYYVNKQVTLEQMIHSGTIGYLQNSGLENKMVEFDKLISFVKYRDEREAVFNEQAIKYANSLFNYFVLENIPGNDSVTLDNVPKIISDPGQLQSLQSFLQSNPPLADSQQILISQYLNFCHQRIAMLKLKISVYRESLVWIENLSSELKKDYNLE